jgi:hypothetical protein
MGGRTAISPVFIDVPDDEEVDIALCTRRP